MTSQEQTSYWMDFNVYWAGSKWQYKSRLRIGLDHNGITGVICVLGWIIMAIQE